jgi:tetratricopeptide (TPR) repeat protein
LVTRLFGGGDITAVVEPSGPEDSTVTAAIDARRGNCAALAALALSVAERLHVPLEAIVSSQHVVVRAPGTPSQVFELLDHGRAQDLSRRQRESSERERAEGTVVQPKAFLSYYLDNLAVRFAEAGDDARALAMFESAIEAGPHVARIRFNYGTYLLGAGQLKPAEKQLRRSVRLESGNGSAWANLGVAVAKQGDTVEARSCFERALRYDRGNRIAAENLKALSSGGLPPRP